MSRRTPPRHLHPGHPAVGALTDALEPGRRERAQIDRRTRPLDRLEVHPRFRDRPPLAFVPNRVGRPQRVERVEEFVELRAAAAKRRTGGLVLLRRPADAESGQQPAAADHVDTRQLPGQLDGRIPGCDEHAAAQPRRGGGRRGDRQCDERIQVGAELLRDGVLAAVTHRRVDRGQQPVPHPEAVGAELFGGRREAGQSPSSWADSPNCGTANPSTTVRLVLSVPRIRVQDLTRCSPAETMIRSQMTAQPSPPLSDNELELINAYWRAANYLSVGQIYLLDNPLLREPLAAEHIKPRLLGHWGTTPGSEPHLCASEPHHPPPRPRRHLHHRARPRRPGAGGQRLSGGHLQRGVHGHRRGHRRDAKAVPPVLISRRCPQPRRRGDTRVDPRGRRAGLCAGARLRRGFRQPGPGGGMRDRRRRGRDRSAGRQLAFQQVPQPRHRRRGAADPAPQRLQDRQPDGAGPHPAGGTRVAALRLRLPADHRRR